MEKRARETELRLLNRGAAQQSAIVADTGEKLRRTALPAENFQMEGRK
jgi:hypothetical protein